MHIFTPVAAALAVLQPDPAPQHLEKILVTAVASRVVQAVESTPSTVSVIEREELDRTLATDIREALRYEPDISVENGATRFGLGNIAIRGLDGNRVQMLQDGIRLPDNYKVGSFSNASRNPYDVSLLSRIEVLRGPGSALYGSDALAGVVSLTTLDPADVMAARTRFGGYATAAYASADEATSVAGVAAADAGRAQFLLGATRTEGHERENQGDNESVGAARTAPNPQDAREESVLAKVVVPAADGGRWRGTVERFDRRVATDVLSLNPQSPRTQSLTGDDRAERTRMSLDRVHYALGPIDELSWIAYHQDSETTQATVEVRANTTAQCLSAAGNVSCRREATFHFRQREDGFTAIARGAAGKHEWIGGAEWSRIETEESRDGRQVNLNTGAVTNVVGTDIFPTRDFPRSRVERMGAFAQDTFILGGASIIPALRYDRFEMTPQPDDVYTASNPGRVPVGATDSAWSPKIGALVPLVPGLTLALQAAAGFRAPPYFDVNVGLSNLPLGYTVIANPDLKPESSRGFEAALRAGHGPFEGSLTAYRTDYDDLIVSRAPLPCPGDPRCVPTAPITFQSQNVTRARIEGIEVRALARFAPGWNARLGAAAARGNDLTKHVPLNSVDPAKVVAGLEWQGQVRGWDAVPLTGAQLHLTHAAKKTRIDASAGTLYATPAYTTLDLTGFVKVGRHVVVNAGVFNLTDRKYWLWSDVRGILNPGATIDRYTQPGRNAAVQVKVSF